MPALSKFLVLLTLFLLASHAKAFTSLSSVAGDQVRVNHLIPLQQPLSKPTNEPSREPIREPTKRMDLDAKLPNNFSNNRVSFSDAPVRNEQEIVSKPASITNSHNSWQMPSAINLDSSGLRCSSRTEILKRRDKVYSHTTQVYQDSPLRLASKRFFKSALVLFSSICSVGYGLTSSICSVDGLPSLAHSLQVKGSSTTPNSVFSKAIYSFHRVNKTSCIFLLVARAKCHNKSNVFVFWLIVASHSEGARFAPNFDRSSDLDSPKLIVIFLEISFHFCEDYSMFREGENTR
jgi:hypothetical protein